MLIGWSLFNVEENWYSFWLALDKVIYGFVGYVYQIFLALANTSPFSESAYRTMVNKIYALIGIIMLFALTYELLMMLIDPDKSLKDNKPTKLIMNIVSSVVIIILLPTIFNFVERFQETILNNDVIGKIILGSTEDASANKTIKQGGYTMAARVFEAFFKPAHEASAPTEISGGGFNCYFPDDTGPAGLSTLDDAYKCAEETGDYDPFSTLVAKVYIKESKGEESPVKIDYTCFISSIAGAFLVYVIVSFCFDLGIRVVKLLFLQLIAPVPVIMKVISKWKDVFNNWLKMLISVYLEVFIRIAIMDFGVLLIQLIIDNKDKWIGPIPNNIRLFTVAFLVMGVVAFIKQAPKLLSKLFPGLDSSNMKLGIKDKLAAGGAFAAGAGVGGLVTSGIRNGVHAWKNAPKGISLRRKLLNTVASAIGGATSGGIHGLWNGRNASSFNDMRNSASHGANVAARNRDLRDNRQQHRREVRKNTAEAFRAHGISGAIATATEDIRSDISNFATGGYDKYKNETEFYSQLKTLDDSTESIATELMNRELISNSSAIAGQCGYSMSLDAMREKLSLMRDKSFASGMEVTDVNGHTSILNSEDQYLEYIANLKNDVSKAERDIKKYIKSKGYEGESGIADLETLGVTLSGGEKQRLAKLSNNAQQTKEILETNAIAVSTLNGHVSDPADVRTAVDSWDDADQLITNIKNREIEIANEQAKLERDKAARDARRGNSNNNGGGHH